VLLFQLDIPLDELNQPSYSKDSNGVIKLEHFPDQLLHVRHFVMYCTEFMPIKLRNNDNQLMLVLKLCT